MHSPHKPCERVFGAENARLCSRIGLISFAVSDQPLAGGEPRFAAAALAATGDVALLLPRIKDAAFFVFATRAGDSVQF